jgi:hypothetical protein
MSFHYLVYTLFLLLNPIASKLLERLTICPLLARRPDRMSKLVREIEMFGINLHFFFHTMPFDVLSLSRLHSLPSFKPNGE